MGSLQDSDSYRQERWFHFRRKKFKEGFIDVWTGDCGHSPNCISKPNFNLNSNTQYFRLNGIGEWKNTDEFLYGFTHTFSCDRLYYTADEIWKTYFIEEEKKEPGD